MVPPAGCISWNSNACTWSFCRAYLGCAPSLGTPPPGMTPMPGRAGMAPNTSLPPPPQRWPPGSVSRYFLGFSTCGSRVMITPSSLHKPHNLPLSSSSPWTWLPLLSPNVFTPPQLLVPRWTQGCIPLHLSPPGLYAYPLSETGLLAPSVYFALR